MKLIKPNFWKNINLIVFLIWPLTLITRLIIIIKNYQKAYKPDIPTICVGNIYLGGTGKTQLVIKLDQILKKKFKIFIIKKKYDNQLDEQKLLNKKTKLIVPNKRIEGLKKIKANKKNIAIFDDGLQDKSIKYSISIVCFSGLEGFGNKQLLPAGPLRESLHQLKNYDAVFINGIKNYSLIKNIRSFNKKINVFSGKYYLQNIKKFNLKLRLSKSYLYKNILSFGDTLHKVHPLAGQGFNMTVRDIKSLTDQIQKNIDLGLELSTAIFSFEKERKHNNFFFAYGIDFLHDFFKKENRFKILDNKKISETLDNSFFLKKISEKFANKGFNF